jgi:hypothetical protein
MARLSLLTPRKRLSGSGRAPRDGFCPGECLPLPPGEVFAEEAVRVFRDAESGVAVAIGDEAWVAVQVDRRTVWYAMWCPYDSGWEVLSIEMEPQPEPAAGRGLRRCIG